METKTMKQADAIFTADIHLREDTPKCRTDNFLRAQARKINWLRKLQQEHKCPILNAGDLFHKAKPSLELVRWAIMKLSDLYSVPGQHDLPNHSINHFNKSGIGLLDTSPNIVCAPGIYYGDKIIIYIVPYEGTVPEIDISYSHWKHILLWHTFVYQGAPPFPGAEKVGNTALALLKKYPEFDIIVTGDNHQSFVESLDGRYLINAGSMMRTTAIQEDFQPRVYLWYKDTNKIVPAYYPIKEDVISREHIEKEKEKNERIDAFVSQLKDNVEIGLSFEVNLAQYIKENNINKKIEDIIWECANG